MHLTVCSYHVTYVCHSESTRYICLNIKELLSRNRRDILILNDYNGTRTHNHLVCKQTLNHLAKLTKWLSWVLSTYLYDAFDYMFLSCHTRVSEWIHIQYLPECQGTFCSKEGRYLKFKWLQQDPNQQLFSSSGDTQPFGQTQQMIEQNYEYLSVRCIWLYVPITSRTRFSVNLLPIFVWMSRNSLLERGDIYKV